MRRHFDAHGRGFDLRDAFAGDSGRFESLRIDAPEVVADLSKNLLDPTTLQLLLDARSATAASKRSATRCCAGEPINSTEGRAVLHTALRAPRGSGPDSAPRYTRARCACSTYAERVRDAASSGIRHVVNIGIGGTDLGPQMAVRGARRVRASGR